MITKCYLHSYKMGDKEVHTTIKSADIQDGITITKNEAGLYVGCFNSIIWKDGDLYSTYSTSPDTVNFLERVLNNENCITKEKLEKIKELEGAVTSIMQKVGSMIESSKQDAADLAVLQELIIKTKNDTAVEQPDDDESAKNENDNADRLDNSDLPACVKAFCEVTGIPPENVCCVRLDIPSTPIKKITVKVKPKSPENKPQV